MNGIKNLIGERVEEGHFLRKPASGFILVSLYLEGQESSPQAVVVGRQRHRDWSFVSDFRTHFVPACPNPARQIEVVAA